MGRGRVLGTGRQLGDDAGAVASFLDRPGDAPDLSFRSALPLEHVVGVHRR
jgi:hypothetical protein